MQNSKAKNQHSANLDKTNGSFQRLEDTVEQILITVNDFATQTQEQFEKIDQRFEKIESQMATKEDLAKLECRLVTKSYLDDKLADVISEIGAGINRVKDKGKLFNQKLVNYLDKHTVFETSEINELKELI